MIESFLFFNNHLQIFICEMNNFDYDIACEIWPEEKFNFSNSEEKQNHFWNKFLQCGRAPVLFYSRLDLQNRERLFNYIISKQDN